ncbi:MAG: lysophospholipase [Verrucomicrobiaceae bacterium]|nr:lysophospholipase [Verrucomicrobiaceae bacterium]
MKKRSFKKKLTWITALVVTTCLTGYTWAEERPADLKEVSYDASVGPDVITYDFRLPAFKKGADRKADPNDPKKYLGHCYVRFALEQINAKMPSNQFVFINRGIQGNTVADLRNRWQRDALDLKPDVLSILIGVNDVAKKDLTVASFETEYRTILEQSRKINPDLKIILLDPLAIKTGNYARWDRPLGRMQEFREVVSKLAREFDAVHIRTQEAFEAAAQATSGGDWLHDGIHPTGKGHRLITKQWLKAVSERWPLEKQEEHQ